MKEFQSFWSRLTTTLHRQCTIRYRRGREPRTTSVGSGVIFQLSSKFNFFSGRSWWWHTQSERARGWVRGMFNIDDDSDGWRVSWLSGSRKESILSTFSSSVYGNDSWWSHEIPSMLGVESPIVQIVFKTPFFTFLNGPIIHDEFFWTRQRIGKNVKKICVSFDVKANMIWCSTIDCSEISQA